MCFIRGPHRNVESCHWWVSGSAGAVLRCSAFLDSKMVIFEGHRDLAAMSCQTDVRWNSLFLGAKGGVLDDVDEVRRVVVDVDERCRFSTIWPVFWSFRRFRHFSPIFVTFRRFSPISPLSPLLASPNLPTSPFQCQSSRRYSIEY